MGDVYRALHTGLRKEVALKVIGDLDSQRAVEDRDVRFEREARTIAVLDHPNCVRVLDYGRTRKHQYIAMQLLDGTTLAQALRTGGRMATARAVNIARGLLAGLVHAHARGVLHRDIKPENVMLSASGRPTLIDFGLARLRDDAPLTARGMCIGSPSYLAPERLDGRPHDARADVYAVGVILYEMIAGVRPFVGDSTVEILSNCRHRPPRPLRAIRRDVSRPLDAVVVRALAKDPRRRFDDAEEMLAALEDVPVLEEQEEREAAVARQEQETTTMLALAPLEPRPSRWQRLWSWWRFGRWRWPRSRRTVGA
ncbi:MAG: serine/threonine protein kinase [Deltaproteobacteria bacterium]|nr:serine/threonine protein kinase [Deltaproteobacteria bacterium]